MKMTIHTATETQFGVSKAVLRPNTEDKDPFIHKQRFSDGNRKNDAR